MKFRASFWYGEHSNTIQRGFHVASIGVASIGLLFYRTTHDFVESRINVGMCVRWYRDALVQNAINYAEFFAVRHSALTSQHLVEDHTQCIDIGPHVGWAIAEVLRSHITRSSARRVSHKLPH